MAAPAPPVLRWTPVREDLDDAPAVYRWNLGPRVVIFTYVPAIALLPFTFALVLIGELLFATVTVVAAGGVRPLRDADQQPAGVAQPDGPAAGGSGRRVRLRSLLAQVLPGGVKAR